MPCVCQLMASPPSRRSLPRAGVVDDNELVCKDDVGEEWGRESPVYHSV